MSSKKILIELKIKRRACNMSNIIYKELSDKLIGLAITVHKTVGPGFLEHVYEESICVELKLNNIHYNRQKVYSIFYKNNPVGSYIADLVINNKIILELKSVPYINRNIEAQLLNYLHVSGIRVGYVINFKNIVIEFKRFVL
jgi:GxxExxY protein